MSEPGSGFQRNVKAIIDAYMAGLHSHPPAISAREYRQALRMVGVPLDETDDLEPPVYVLPEFDEDDEDLDDPGLNPLVFPVSPDAPEPEEPTNGNEPA